MKAVYDLSATPFYLKGSGYPEGTLFPWVVSDFSLIDAIECGHRQDPARAGRRQRDDRRLPEVPRPVGATSATGCRRRAARTEDARRAAAAAGRAARGAAEPLRPLRDSSSPQWEADEEARANGSTPPVFIVVCNNTNVSKPVFDYIAGYETEHATRTATPVVAPGKLPLFSNVDGPALAAPAEHDPRRQPAARIRRGHVRRLQEARRPPDRGVQGRVPPAVPRPRRRRPDRRRPDARGAEHGRQGRASSASTSAASCRVSMLTEGWDANTVTHILGVRAFGTQLLCEQVVGRGLRRLSYAVDDDGLLRPGVRRGLRRAVHVHSRAAACRRTPPSRGPAADARARPRAAASPWLRSRSPASSATASTCRPSGSTAKFTTTRSSPLDRRHPDARPRTRRSSARRAIHTLDDLKTPRAADEVAFLLATAPANSTSATTRATTSPGCSRNCSASPALARPSASRCKDDTFPQLLLLVELPHDAAEKIYRAIVAAHRRRRRRCSRSCSPYDAVGTTALRRSTRPKTVWTTDADEVPRLTTSSPTATWEQKLAQSSKRWTRCGRYVKNQGLGFTIPYTSSGGQRQLLPRLHRESTTATAPTTC